MGLEKRIYALRHAKAVAASGQQDDLARPLTERGRRDAQLLGAHMRSAGIAPQHVICSPSLRTRQTVELFYKDAPEPPIDFTEQLYLATPDDILALLQPLPESVASVMLVGHSPGLQMFCQQLARAGDEEALDTLNEQFPTCSFAEIALQASSWKELKFGDGYLTGLLLPKDLPALVA